MNRRTLLHGVGATGAAGVLGGCLGTVEREYEATPVSVPEDVARENGFDPTPSVERQTASLSRDVAVTSVEAELTGYIYRYEHRGDDVADIDDGRAAGTRDTGTSTPTPTPTRTPPDTGGDDDDDGRTRTETSTSTVTSTATRTPIDTTPTSPSTPTGEDATGRIEEVEPDRLNVTTTPDPNFVGQSINPAATKSIETLIEEETAAFEQACDCTIEDPEEVEVESVSDPTEVRVDRGDIARIFQIDPTGQGAPDLPETVELLGEERPVGYFAFATSTEEENGAQANLAAVAKGTSQIGSGSNEAVVASYVATGLFELGIHLIQPDTTSDRSTPEDETSAQSSPDPGMFSAAQVETAADRLTSICPSMTGGEVPAEPTTTPTPVTTQRSWDGTVRRTPPLKEAVFRSDGAVVSVQFDNAITAGNRVSASVARSTGDDLDVSEYEVTIAGNAVDVTVDSTVVDLPEDVTAIDIRLIHRERGEVATAGLPVLSEYQGRYDIPVADGSLTEITSALEQNDYTYLSQSVVTSGGQLGIFGLFDGDISSTTVTADDRTVPLIAESHRKVVAKIPEGIRGQTTVELSEGNATETFDVWIGDVSISPDTATVEAGETTTLTVDVRGMGGLENKPLPAAFLTLENANPQAARLENGTPQTVWIYPNAMDGGTFTTSLTVTGNEGGRVGVSETLRGGPPPGEPIAYPDSPLLASPQLPDAPEVDLDDPRKVREAIKTRQMELALVEQFREWKEGTDADTTKSLQKLQQAAFAIAKCLITEAFRLFYDAGWARGNLGTAVGYCIPGQKGRCGHWATAMRNAFVECQENDKFDSDCFSIKLVGAKKHDHQALVIFPADGNFKHGLVFDPWRVTNKPVQKQFPPWFPTDEDPDYDWRPGLPGVK